MELKDLMPELTPDESYSLRRPMVVFLSFWGGLLLLVGIGGGEAIASPYAGAIVVCAVVVLFSALALTRNLSIVLIARLVAARANSQHDQKLGADRLAARIHTDALLRDMERAQGLIENAIAHRDDAPVYLSTALQVLRRGTDGTKRN